MNKLILGVGVYEKGKFTTSIGDGNTKFSKEYSKWKCMLNRCYLQSYLNKHPSYIGCSVSENFKNFQYFAEWCNNQVGFHLTDKNGRVYHLDKDILVQGNRIYSEYTCVFIPAQLNNFLTDNQRSRGDYPLGVFFNKEKKAFTADLRNPFNSKRRLGTFASAEEAHNAYVEAKSRLAKELADYYKGKVDDRVISALLAFKPKSDVNIPPPQYDPDTVAFKGLETAFDNDYLAPPKVNIKF